jgi:hypothetical protein
MIMLQNRSVKCPVCRLRDTGEEFLFSEMDVSNVRQGISSHSRGVCC